MKNLNEHNYSISQQSPMYPELSEGESFKIFDHDIQLRDKIFYTKMDKNLTQRILDYTLSEYHTNPIDHRKNLVGNVKNEISLSFHNNLQLFDEIKNTLRFCVSNFYGSLVRDVFVEGVWVNIINHNEHIPIHVHDGFLSFVWYLQIPDAIRDEWQEQIGNRKHTQGCIEFLSGSSDLLDLHFSPSTSDFFLFTADHRHTVYPFKNENETRISMSGNISHIQGLNA